MRLFLLCFIATPLWADPPRIENATASPGANGWRLDVTLRHPDSDWDHYADGWQVLAPDGTVLGSRELVHPHEHEQPFTRSLSGVQIPEGLAQVRIRAHCKLDGWGAEEMILTLPR